MPKRTRLKNSNASHKAKRLKREYAPTLKEAKEWAKVIVKDKTAKVITVFRLPKKEWF